MSFKTMSFSNDPMREAADKEGFDLDYTSYEDGDKSIQLDGDFLIEESEFILKWMKEHAET